MDIWLVYTTAPMSDRFTGSHHVNRLGAADHFPTFAPTIPPHLNTCPLQKSAVGTVITNVAATARKYHGPRLTPGGMHSS